MLSNHYFPILISINGSMQDITILSFIFWIISAIFHYNKPSFIIIYLKLWVS